VVWDGAKLVTLVDGQEVYRYVPPAPTTYLAPPPVVADLSGRRRILVRDAASNYLLCSAEGKQQRVFLERPYEVPEPVADSTGAGLGPLVCDVDGDGDNEVVATVTDDRGRPGLCHPGRQRQGETAAGAAAGHDGTQPRADPAGSVRGSGGGFCCACQGKGPITSAATWSRPMTGAGKQLWVRSSYGQYGKNPVDFMAHFPSAKESPPRAVLRTAAKQTPSPGACRRLYSGIFVEVF
jgi:hypothetical protein